MKLEVNVMNLRIAGVSLLLLTTVSPFGAVERLKLRVTPSVAFAPATLVVRTTIEPDAQNRAMEIVAESSDFYRSSEFDLEGDRSPRTTTLELRGLPAGTYEVSATLMGPGSAVRARTTQEVDVMGDDGDAGD
jgi:hypothetical protein